MYEYVVRYVPIVNGKYICAAQYTHIKAKKEIQLWIEFNKCKKRKLKISWMQ